MSTLVDRYADRILGVLSCYDRVILRGGIRGFDYAQAMESYLRWRRIPLFDFPKFAKPYRDAIRDNAERLAREHGLEVQFIRNRRERKEDIVARILEKRGEGPGLVAILSALETCESYEARYDKKTGRTSLRPDRAKCTHYYFYFIDEQQRPGLRPAQSTGGWHARLGTAAAHPPRPGQHRRNLPRLHQRDERQHEPLLVQERGRAAGHAERRAHDPQRGWPPTRPRAALRARSATFTTPPRTSRSQSMARAPRGRATAATASPYSTSRRPSGCPRSSSRRSPPAHRARASSLRDRGARIESS